MNPVLVKAIRSKYEKSWSYFIEHLIFVSLKAQFPTLTCQVRGTVCPRKLKINFLSISSWHWERKITNLHMKNSHTSYFSGLWVSRLKSPQGNKNSICVPRVPAEADANHEARRKWPQAWVSFWPWQQTALLTIVVSENFKAATSWPWWTGSGAPTGAQRPCLNTQLWPGNGRPSLPCAEGWADQCLGGGSLSRAQPRTTLGCHPTARTARTILTSLETTGTYLFKDWNPRAGPRMTTLLLTLYSHHTERNPTCDENAGGSVERVWNITRLLLGGRFSAAPATTEASGREGPVWATGCF